jgi:hypothetical protein
MKMENTMFRHLSPMQVCRRMAVICQKSANQTPAGAEHDQLQAASDKFSDEANSLAINDLQQALTAAI